MRSLLTTRADAMTKAAASRARVSAGALVFVVVVLAGVSGSCSDSRLSLGESCLRDEDCLSDVCAQQRCAAAAPVLDESAREVEASGDEVQEEASADSGPGADGPFGDVLAKAGADSAVDATDAADAVTEARSEAALDAPADGRADASIDAQLDQLDSSADGAEGG